MSASPLVFPLGHYVGVRQSDERHLIRVGFEHQSVSAGDFGLWVLAHGPAEVGHGRWTTEQLYELAAAAGLSEPAAGTDRLVGQGVIALVPPELEQAFVRAHRMQSLMVGLGNTADAPDVFRVGLPGMATPVTLDQSSYELWQWGGMVPDLWRSCEVRAAVAEKLDVRVNPDELVGELIGDLRVLLAHSCAYLDVAQPR
jgi:hypothetical protein